MLVVVAAQDARRLADLRYQGGATSYLEVLDSDTRLFVAELGLVQAQLAELTAFVEIYRALGGGWQVLRGTRRMSQRNVEILIGRLLTDEDLRRSFTREPAATLDEFCQQGWELTPSEIEALLSQDVAIWSEMARRIPSKLQRCSLRTE